MFPAAFISGFVQFYAAFPLPVFFARAFDRHFDSLPGAWNTRAQAAKNPLEPP